MEGSDGGSAMNGTAHGSTTPDSVAAAPTSTAPVPIVPAASGSHHAKVCVLVYLSSPVSCIRPRAWSQLEIPA